MLKKLGYLIDVDPRDYRYPQIQNPGKYTDKQYRYYIFPL